MERRGLSLQSRSNEQSRQLSVSNRPQRGWRPRMPEVDHRRTRVGALSHSTRKHGPARTDQQSSRGEPTDETNASMPMRRDYLLAHVSSSRSDPSRRRCNRAIGSRCALQIAFTQIHSIWRATETVSRGCVRRCR